MVIQSTFLKASAGSLSRFTLANHRTWVRSSESNRSSSIYMYPRQARDFRDKTSVSKSQLWPWILFLTGWASGKILFNQSLHSVTCYSNRHLIIKNCSSFTLSEMEDSCHVLEENGDVYSATLGLVDIVRGTNSYYKLQLLKEDKAHRWGARTTFLFNTVAVLLSHHSTNTM